MLFDKLNRRITTCKISSFTKLHIFSLSQTSEKKIIINFSDFSHIETKPVYSTYQPAYASLSFSLPSELTILNSSSVTFSSSP